MVFMDILIICLNLQTSMLHNKQILNKEFSLRLNTEKKSSFHFSFCLPQSPSKGQIGPFQSSDSPAA